MLQAFLDESGIHRGSKNVALAGYVADASAWVRFDRLWQEEIARQGVEDFHAKDFLKREGKYHGWSEERLKGSAESLVAAACSEELYPLGGVVPTVAFGKRSELERRILTGGSKVAGVWKRTGKPSAAYFLIFPFIFVQAERATPSPEPVHYIFDSQLEYDGYARQWFNFLRDTGEGRLGGIDYWRREDVAGLQLADLFAHLLYRGFQPNGFADPLLWWCYERLSERDRQLRNLSGYSEHTMDLILNDLISREQKS